jgi:hypothetical protein
MGKKLKLLEYLIMGSGGAIGGYYFIDSLKNFYEEYYVSFLKWLYKLSNTNISIKPYPPEFEIIGAVLGGIIGVGLHYYLSKKLEI